MNKYNDKGEQHGPWEKYYSNGKSYWRANYVNGKLHGLRELYFYGGNLYLKQYYL